MVDSRSQTAGREPRTADSRDERVAVIGAGVAGLVSAKVLKEDGFDVTVYEKGPAIGGVWERSRAYPGLRTNNPRETYAFSDFDYPSSSDPFPTARQVRGYLEAYAGHFGLTPHIRLASEVVRVSRREPRSDGAHPGFRVTARPTPTPDRVAPDATAGGSSHSQTHDFDFVVICNGVFSVPYVPDLEGRERFDGRVLHSSELTDPDGVRTKRVVVVGAGKSALDCATAAAEEADAATLVFRTPHWMIPRYFGSARVDDVLFSRFSSQVFPAYHNATQAAKALRRLAGPVFWLWRTAVGLIARRVGKVPAEMLPEVPVTSGIENNGIGTEFYDVLRNGRVHTRRAGIASYAGPDRIRLDTGEELEADVVIFATGWRQDVSFLEPRLREEVWRNGTFHLHRHILPPGEQRMGFIGYASSGNVPLTSEIAAHWLSQLFRGELTLPDTADMERELAKVRRWTHDVFPRRREGYFIGAYVAQYVDELMRDMGLQTRRMSSFFREYWGPLWGRRYRGVAEERRQLRGNRIVSSIDSAPADGTFDPDLRRDFRRSRRASHP